MLNKIIAFSINNKLIIGLFMIALVSYGIYETTKLPIDAVPDITNNQNDNLPKKLICAFVSKCLCYAMLLKWFWSPNKQKNCSCSDLVGLFR